MDKDENRLRTFRDWPSDAPVTAATAVRGGFYSTGQGLEVQCWKCGGRISEWGSGDIDLQVLHRRLDYSCPYAAANVTSSTSDPNDTNDTIYKIEILRLISFTDWPVTYISRESLATAGFYYKRGPDSRDRVRCAWCGGELMNWERGDDPLVEHLKHFPHCHYAKNKQREYNSQSNWGGTKQGVSSGNSSAECDNAALLQGGVEGVILGVGEASDVTMANTELREKSFTPNWPPHLQQKPKDLAAAGFYYVGPVDQVRCFQCGGGLESWRLGDNPWVEHAKWYPSCKFLALSGNKQHWIDLYMEQPPAIQALACGLQPHSLRKAIASRLRTNATPFPDTESLINAALSEQDDEEIFAPPSPVIYTSFTGSEVVEADTETAEGTSEATPPADNATTEEVGTEGTVVVEEGCKSNLEEENRKLKEARLCKVCMDNEVGIVFLPCGHLLSCVQCSPCLTACPLCRASIKGVVRTYLS